MIYEINMYDTRNLLIHVRSHQHADESARRETRRPYAQSQVGVQVEDNTNVRACVSARAFAYVQVCVFIRAKIARHSCLNTHLWPPEILQQMLAVAHSHVHKHKN